MWGEWGCDNWGKWGCDNWGKWGRDTWGGKWKSEREKKHLLALLHRRGGRERLLDERRRDELELFERVKKRIKGEIWGKVGCDIWEKWVGWAKRKILLRARPPWASRRGTPAGLGLG